MNSLPGIPCTDITGLLLAGGLGRRMGGADKGLVTLGTRPMASLVLERLRPQVGQLLINANRNLDEWQVYGVPVVGDEFGGFSGPLAGIHAGLRHCSTPWLLVVPCDSPFFPGDMVAQLAAAVAQQDAELAAVRTGDGLQPVFALMRRDVLPGLERFLNSGGRSIHRWFGELHCAIVDFPDAAAFANINTPQELAQFSR
jgi:molybdopterin-guanine dinucleotide biosynthesis protein A